MEYLHFPDNWPISQPEFAYDFYFEKYSLSKDDFEDLIFDEIIFYHSDEIAFKYIKEKEDNTEGALHLKYRHRLIKAFKE